MAILKQAFFWPMAFTDGGYFAYDPATLDGVFLGNGPFYQPYDVAQALLAGFDACATYSGNVGVEINPTTLRVRIYTLNEDVFEFDCSGISGQATPPLGFQEALYTGAAEYVADVSRLRNLWTPAPAVFRDPGDQREEPDTAVNVAVGGRGKVWYEARHTVRPLRFEYLPPAEVYKAREVGADRAALERLWEDGRARVRYWQDKTSLLASVGYTGDYYLDQATVREFKPERGSYQKELYGFDLMLRGYV